ncbi:MAG: ADP-ribosylglycohydrolase family protein [Muribaculaceae bacterium]|nr:ADP-ribosylglycohydrolase family protein [Muribaculaceae bacterium]
MNFSDRIKGAIFGMALGDALGLGSEFMTADEVKFHYPDGLRHFSQIIRDAHRCFWKRGEWTNDTSVNLILIKSIMTCGKFDVRHFASLMKAHYQDDTTDMPDFYNKLLQDPDWAEQPLEVTHHLWRNNNMWRARNEALPRALISGILGYPRIIGNTLDCISVTHDDTRCTCAGIIIATMADSLLRKGEPATYRELRDLGHTHDARLLHALERAYNGEIKDLELDDPDNLWQVRKCMAAGLWPLWHCNSAEETLHNLIDAGGDANTNATVAMGLAGLKYGFNALPEEIKNLPNYEELEEIADNFVEFMKRYEAEKQHS